MSVLRRGHSSCCGENGFKGDKSEAGRWLRLRPLPSSRWDKVA